MKPLSVLSLLFSVVTTFADTNSVERGLAWLCAQQRDNGSWSDNAALNALPMLAMLSAGQTPGVRPFDSPLDRGLRFLLSQQDKDGAFTAGGGMMYGHALAALLLAESAGMTRDDRFIRPALQRAVALILRAQTVEKGEFHAGGWRYEPASTDSDLSVTIWQVIALKAAHETGVSVPRAAMESAARYIKRCEHPSGGFAYQPGGLPNESRTAGAIIALRLCGLWDDPAIGRARVWLEQHPLRWECDYFYHAACHTAHARAGFDAKMVQERQNADGSWPASPHSRNEAKAGPLYSTSMAILALTARWNYLPVFME
ncbi:MAG: terpene cyclase/mutase family protein [Verrucomicrobia bacterium]|nr:terpene cyclase/mutase family protein [Verrucomicrobiota bacterium]